MPTKTNELLNGMKVDPSKRTMEYAKYGADTTYGTSTEEVMALGRVSAWETVFPPVPPGELTDEEVKQELGGLLAKRGRHRPTAVAEYIALEARMGTEAVAKMREEQKPKGNQITGERRI